ncbi:hypothetical protein B0O99DRAFT_692715 [Bisporella sp. PMI_857]|nr:hypothetical protein B0O99DRAFT_692715 [Bisporella sp. PMI_857]
MSDFLLKDELNRSLEGRFKRTTDYDAVAVLVIYWKKCKNKGYKDEAHKVGELFSQDFGYSVQYYGIPSIDSELEMDARINTYLRDNRKVDTLLIIHYGGHGNADDEYGQSQESVWCAESDADSPSLKWSNIQPKLAQHNSEVLLLLDCCYGSQAARDSLSRRRSPIPRNLELFAACGMGEKTVGPGRYSFTSLLIAELRAQLTIRKFAVVAIAHKNMASKDSLLAQSAVYFPFEKKNGTTRLEPFKKPGSSDIGIIAEAASLVLQLSITDNDRQAFEEVIEWLKLNPPRTVSKVVVENIITTASGVYSYASSQEDGSRSMGSFKKFPEPAKRDISSTWGAFNTTIAALATSLRKFPTLFVSSDPLDRSDVAGDFVHQLDRCLRPLESAIERNIMSLPELNDETVLLTAIDDKIMEDLGFVETLNLRLVANFGVRTEGGSGLEVDLDSSKIKDNGPFLNLSIQDIPPLGRVLVECKDYDELTTNKSILAVSKKRMEKLAGLLNSSKSADFHTLTCLRFFVDSQLGRSGLIFAIPEESRQCQISLRDIIRKVVGKYKPTLGQRFHIAHTIGKAIAKWHLVGWVHQGVASHNIVFFYDETHGIDYSKPYLCGFGYSRESDAPSTSRLVENFEANVYRHPDRQGWPSKFHRKEHDIYAYGVLLLEIGLWKAVETFFDEKERKSITPYAMGQKILRTSKELLGHSMDTLYEQAASTCLSGDFGVKQDDITQSCLAAAFDIQVLGKIGRGVAFEQ